MVYTISNSSNNMVYEYGIIVLIVIYNSPELLEVGLQVLAGHLRVVDLRRSRCDLVVLLTLVTPMVIETLCTTSNNNTNNTNSSNVCNNTNTNHNIDTGVCKFSASIYARSPY